MTSCAPATREPLQRSDENSQIGQTALDLLFPVCVNISTGLEPCRKLPGESLASLGLRKLPTRHQRKAVLKSHPPPQRKPRPRQPNPETRRPPTQTRHLQSSRPSKRPRNFPRSNPRNQQAAKHRRPSQQNQLPRSPQSYLRKRAKTVLQQLLQIKHPLKLRANPPMRQ